MSLIYYPSLPATMMMNKQTNSVPKKKILTQLKTNTVLIHQNDHQKESFLVNPSAVLENHPNYSSSSASTPTYQPNTPTTPSNTSQCSNQSNASGGGASGLLWSFSQEYNKKQLPTFKNFKTKAVKGGFQSDWKATGQGNTSTTTTTTTTTTPFISLSSPPSTTPMTLSNTLNMMCATTTHNSSLSQQTVSKKTKSNNTLATNQKSPRVVSVSMCDQSPISLESVDSSTSNNDLIWVSHSPTMNHAVSNVAERSVTIPSTTTTTTQTCHLIFSNLMTSKKKKKPSKKRLSAEVSTNVTTAVTMNAMPTMNFENSNSNFASTIVNKDHDATPNQILENHSLSRIDKPAHKMSSSLPRKTRERITIQELLN
ncbi:hypothetical protein C9374_008046 [Naegleria lovaniensis]|uniref:Uncharacterized protein n=1 Tax=Naegleria lovaniensis TaxID=51637 RepID=A0AA88KIH4_NAELO|nr:uncharacterized protein C9374_012744 [Naegleria lovaniensis]XP_044546160.1 uncharacterized protein C9374_008046 [Naegleria lovaniensis]KAG2373142.1 hypothetical protein C9374_012744 [Naegleria lovaniensis]KAG2378898.1 hypothetical protein C9374_008046 [Naegleria lovaniensis]